MTTFHDSFVNYLDYIQQPIIAAKVLFNNKPIVLKKNYTQKQYELFTNKLKKINMDYNFVGVVTCTIWHTEQSWSTYSQSECGVWEWLFYNYPKLP